MGSGQTRDPALPGWAAAALAAGLPLLAYLATAAPSITWRGGGADSGEVAAAAAVLGVAHPPGYPLYVLLGHLAVQALPWLEPAGATNLLGALLCAAAAALVYRSAGEALGHAPGARPAALAAAWALALGPLWWRQATLTTPHALNLLLAAALCWLVQRAAARGLGPRQGLLAGILLGLSLTHHLTLAAVPLAWLAAVLADRATRPAPAAGPPGQPDAGAGLPGQLNPAAGLRGHPTPADLTGQPAATAGLPGQPATAGLPGQLTPDPGPPPATVAAGLLVGLAPWAALPLIAAAEPAQLWGEPWTPSGFLDLVLAREYAGYLASATPLAHVQRLAGAVRALAGELGPLGLPLALVGAGLTWPTARRYLLFLAALLALLLGFYAAYPARDVESYLLPAAIAAAPPLAAGVAALAGLAARWRLPPGPAAAALAALIALSSLALNGPRLDLSGDRAALDFARTVLDRAPPGALVATDTDRQTFALWYGQRALGLRPDLVLVDRSFLALGWYRRQLARRHPELAPLREGATLEAAAAAAGRPLYSVPPDGS